MNSQLIKDLNECGVAVFAKSESGHYLLANDFATSMLNTTADLMIGKDDFAFFDPASARLMKERDSHIRHSQLAAKYESVARSAQQWQLYHSMKVPVQLDNQKALLGLSVQVSRPNWNNGARLLEAVAPRINSGQLKLESLLEDLRQLGLQVVGGGVKFDHQLEH